MKTVIIGSGNLATHLLLALKGAGMTPSQIYSRTAHHAKELADRVGCSSADNIGHIITDADAYIISVKDDAIQGILEQLAVSPKAVLMHTAGSVSIDVFKGFTRNAAVLYPMQSFTKGIPVNFKEIPCFIEATNDYSHDIVAKLASSISDKVVEIDSEQRRRLHLAAVFASNLANHCYRLAERITEKAGIDFSLFAPLIEETARKATIMSPHDAQTGPMVRGDKRVMQSQMELIDDLLTKEIYQLMAKSIFNDSQQ